MLRSPTKTGKRKKKREEEQGRAEDEQSRAEDEQRRKRKSKYNHRVRMLSYDAKLVHISMGGGRGRV